MSPDAYIREMEDFRRQKDEFFRTSPYSPIPPREQPGFPGLRYFPPDPVYRVSAAVEPFPHPERIQMATSDGEIRSYERYALLRFTLQGQPLTLTAYRTPGDDDLFVPFRDAQAGRETYGAGRYLDNEVPHQHGNAPASLMLDFNLAYNPYCAYNEAYSCPVPPAENNLPVPILAGERIYHEDDEHQ